MKIWFVYTEKKTYKKTPLPPQHNTSPTYRSKNNKQTKEYVRIDNLHKSIAGRYRPVGLTDGPITARYRFIPC